MWFKTRIGLICIEGTVEYFAMRFPRKDGGNSVGVFAYQAHHADFEIKRLLQPSVGIYNRRIYLACFNDGDGADRLTAECMERIERAVHSGEPICDLSDVGNETARGSTDQQGIFVGWRPSTSG